MDYTRQIDYSSLSTYIECPRKFLFRYMMHLDSLKKNINFVFGSAWHYGLEAVYKDLKQFDDISTYSANLATINSMNAFKTLWLVEDAPIEWPNEDTIYPKSPGRAGDMYYEYWKRFLVDDHKDWLVIGVEEPFILDLSQIESDLPEYIGRIDLLLQNRANSSKIKITDHKTAKSVNKVTATGYQTSYQTLGYVAAGSMFFDTLPIMEYNVALCQKTKIDFHRYEFTLRKAQINDFFLELVSHIKRLLADIVQLRTAIETLTDRTESLNCFPRNRGLACTSYFSPCSFVDLCNIRNNPLDWFQTIPSGYSRREWNPDQHEAEIKKKIENLKEA